MEGWKRKGEEEDALESEGVGAGFFFFVAMCFFMRATAAWAAVVVLDVETEDGECGWGAGERGAVGGRKEEEGEADDE